MEKPTYHQIKEQYDSGHSQPTVLVERSGGKITPMRYEGPAANYPGKYLVSDTQDPDRVRLIESFAVSDGYQEMLAAELAGKELLSRRLGVVAVENPQPELSPVRRDTINTLRGVANDLAREQYHIDTALRANRGATTLREIALVAGENGLSDAEAAEVLRLSQRLWSIFMDRHTQSQTLLSDVDAISGQLSQLLDRAS